MKDLEDIFKDIIDYFMEELTLEDDSVMSRINYYISIKNAEKGDDLLESIPNDAGRFVLNQRMKDPKAFKNWIDIAVAETVSFDARFDTVAKTFIISVNSLIMDDLSNNTFYRSVRMAEVLKNLMVDFFKTKTTFGFIDGYPESNTLPERVSVDGAKSLKSGVLYMVTIQ